MGLTIDVIANDGSPLGVTEQSIIGMDGRNGIGGAELAILTLCNGWHKRGHVVTFYNNPAVKGGSVFEHKDLTEFQPQAERDILIIFRSPNHLSYGAKGKKIWFSCDPYTIGDFKEFATRVDAIVGISEFHSNYFKSIYGIHNMQVIDIPVRDWEYSPTPKVHNSCIFTSVPDRGLMQLLPIWDRIIEQVPDASLTITSDWSLWTGCDVSNAVSPFRMAWAGKKNVRYAGAVKREELIRIQSEAEFHLYPSTFAELFCISVAESQVAGAVPITSTTGALETTNRFGYKISGNPTDSGFIDSFVDTTVNLMKLPERVDIGWNARREFGLEEILDIWEKVFNE
jgi:glycosyltransferase involved in cell wall biosynthesis